MLDGLKHHWKRYAISLTLIMVCALLIAPIVANQTGLLKSLINRYSGINGKVEFESANFNWFSYVTFSGLTITDQNRVEIAKIGHLKISRSLLGLAFSGIQDCEINIQDSHLTVSKSGDHLSWTDLLKPTEKKKSGQATLLKVVVENTGVEFREQDIVSGELRGIQGLISMQQGQNGSWQSVQIQAKGQAVNLDQQGPVDVKADLDFSREWELENANVAVTAQQSPLDFLNPLLTHFDAPILTASANGTANLTYRNSNESFQIDSTFDEFELLCVNTKSKFVFAQYPVVPLRLDGNVNLFSDTPSKFNVNTSYGQVKFNGQFPRLNSDNWQAIAEDAFQLEGDFNIAKFASDYPEWIHVRDDVTIEDAKLTFNAFNRAEGARQRLLVDLRTDRFSGQANGKRLDWNNPLQFSCALTRALEDRRAPIKLEFVECKSDFLSIEGSGDVEEGRSHGLVSLKGDLSRLQQKLNDFFDLGDFRIAGFLDGQFNWNLKRIASESQSIQIGGNSTIQGFTFGFSKEDGWNENQLQVKLSGNCQLRNGQLSHLENLETTLNVDTDGASFVLRNPVPFAGDYQSIFDVQLNGDSTKWMRRVNSLFDLGIQLAGTAETTAVVSITPNLFRIRTRQFRIQPFEFKAASVHLAETVARGKIDLVFDRRDGNWKSNELQVESPNTNIVARELQTKTTPDPETVIDLTVTANARPIANWFLPDNVSANGVISGAVKLTSNEKGLSIESQLDSKDIEISTQAESSQNANQQGQNRTKAVALIPKGPATLNSKLVYRDNELRINECRCQAIDSDLSISGVLDFSKSPFLVDLAGNVDTDFQKLIAYVAPSVSSSVKFDGQPTCTLRLKGPLTSTDSTNESPLIPTGMVGSAELNWNGGTVFALPVEKGGMSVELKNSNILIKPEKLKIAKGDFLATPKIVLREQPVAIRVPAGPIIQNADIGPQVFRTWMRYVTPLLADATEAKGRFSIQLNEPCWLPAENPVAGKLDGKMKIDSIIVGPGPLGQSMISIIHQVLLILGKEGKLRSLAEKPWLEMPAQEIEVSIKQGQVTHRKLQFQMGEVTVYTSGSVDMNQNINMVVYVPMDPDWFKENPILKTIAGDVIQIPLRGSLSNPKFDLELLKGLSKRMAMGAVEKLLDEKSGGLFKPGGLLDGKLLKDSFPKADPDKLDLGKLLEDKAGGLLKRGILKGLDKLKEKEK